MGYRPFVFLIMTTEEAYGEFDKKHVGIHEYVDFGLDRGAHFTIEESPNQLSELSNFGFIDLVESYISSFDIGLISGKNAEILPNQLKNCRCEVSSDKLYICSSCKFVSNVAL